MHQHYCAIFQACTGWSCTGGKVPDNAAIMQARQLPFHEMGLATLKVNGLHRV